MYIVVALILKIISLRDHAVLSYQSSTSPKSIFFCQYEQIHPDINTYFIYVYIQIIGGCMFTVILGFKDVKELYDHTAHSREDFIHRYVIISIHVIKSTLFIICICHCLVTHLDREHFARATSPFALLSRSLAIYK